MSTPVETVSIDSEDVVLLRMEPDEGQGGTRITLIENTHLVRSLTERESRRPGWSTERIHLRNTFDLLPAEAASLRTAIATLGSKRVAMPVWIDARAASDWANSYFLPQYAMRLDTGAVIHHTAIAALDPQTIEVVPLVIGYIDRPDINAITEAATITVEEDCPTTWRCVVRDNSVGGTEFPDIDPAYLPTFLDLSRDDIDRIEIGHGREKALEGLDSIHRWGQRALFSLQTADEIRDLMAFFARRCRGRYKSFQMPAWFAPHTSGSAETPDAYIARFGSDQLTIEFVHAKLARTTLECWQLPWELNPPDGEAFELAPISWLYEFSYDVPGGPIVSRYTSWDESKTYSSNEYPPAKIEHTRLRSSMELGESDCELRVYGPDFPEILRQAERNAFGTLTLTISQIDPETPATAPIVRFRDEVAEIRSTGRLMTVSAGRKFRRRWPRAVVEKRDNLGAFDPVYGRSKAAFVRECVVYEVWSDGRKLLLNIDDGGANPDEDFFSGGYGDAGAGTDYNSAGILKHFKAADVGADLSIELDRPMPDVEATDTVYLYPGYSGKWTAAKAAPWNASNAHYNFLGFPFTPPEPPGFELPDDQRGKK